MDNAAKAHELLKYLDTLIAHCNDPTIIAAAAHAHAAAATADELTTIRHAVQQINETFLQYKEFQNR